MVHRFHPLRGKHAEFVPFERLKDWFSRARFLSGIELLRAVRMDG